MNDVFRSSGFQKNATTQRPWFSMILTSMRSYFSSSSLKYGDTLDLTGHLTFGSQFFGKQVSWTWFCLCQKAPSFHEQDLLMEFCSGLTRIDEVINFRQTPSSRRPAHALTAEWRSVASEFQKTDQQRNSFMPVALFVQLDDLVNWAVGLDS